MDEKKFEVGQKWKARNGCIIEVECTTCTRVINGVPFPILGSTGDCNGLFTANGSHYWNGEYSNFDLVELVDESPELQIDADFTGKDSIEETAKKVREIRDDLLKQNIRKFYGFDGQIDVTPHPTPYIPTTSAIEEPVQKLKPSKFAVSQIENLISNNSDEIFNFHKARNAALEQAESHYRKIISLERDVEYFRSLIDGFRAQQ